MTDKFSISELAKLQKEYGLELPTTDRGIAIRAKQENWDYEEVAGRGGKGGIKKIYTLPPYLLEELKAKGLLHLFDKPAKQVENDTAKPHRPYLKTGKNAGGGLRRLGGAAEYGFNSARALPYQRIRQRGQRL